MSRNIDTQNDLTRHIDSLSHDEQQQIWNDCGKVERAFHRFWIGAILLVILILWAFSASANTQIDSQRPSQQAGQPAYGYAERTAPQQAREVLTDTQTSKDWFVSSAGVYRPAATTTNTYIMQPAPVIVEPGKASMRNRITGNDFDSSLIIPDGTNLDTLQTLETATVNATQRYKEKLALLNEENIMNFNVSLFEARSLRQISLAWVSIPLLAILSLCSVYIYRAVHQERRRKLEIELHTIDAGRG